MFKTTIKGLLARKLRLFTTSVAVLIGVAFMAGTLVLTDTIDQTFDDLFATAYDGTDAHVRGDQVVEIEGFEERNRVDAAVVDVVLGVDGVAAASGDIDGYAQIVGRDGDPVGNPNVAPTFGRNWPDDDELNPFDLVEGRAPEAADEVVIDRGLADEGELAVGDRTEALTQAGTTPVTIVGIATFGGTNSPGGSTNVLFETEAAQALVAEPGRFDSINVRAEDGVGEAELRDRVAGAVPGGVEVLTGAQITEEEQSEVGEFVDIIRNFLLAFAVVALFVGVFIIYNTFSIIVAQRTRENALLRAVGASRRQVLTSVVLESVVVGLVAAVAGLAAGVGIAAGLKALFDVLGFDLPATGLVVTPTTVVTAFVVGLVVSVVSAVFPAVRASRVPPLAAMRDVAIDRSGRSWVRIALGALLALLGAGLVVLGLFGDPDNPLLAVGVGALVLIVGIAVLGPTFAGPLTRVIGAPVPRLRGMAGTLARENAVRNPGRTSTTAAALMIGVALVAFISIVSTSAKASFDRIIDRALIGDFFVETGSFGPGSGLSPELADRLNELPEVEAATGLRFLAASVDGEGQFLGAVDPETVGEVIDFDVLEGDLADLGADSVAVGESTAESEGLAVGDEVRVGFPAVGEVPLRVAAVFGGDELTAGAPYLVSHATSEAYVEDQFDVQVYIELAEGVTPEEAEPALAAIVDSYPVADLLDQSEFREAQTGPIDQFLALVYVLLSFSVLIALIGIANTLALSVFERTRELGLLRAVGMTRRQLRSMVRWESVIIALLGTALGLGLGTFFGWATIASVEEEGFNTLSMPWGTLVIIALVAAVAGVLAARRPAKRAARLDVLDAIAAV